jgi:hypothetical protein
MAPRETTLAGAEILRLHCAALRMTADGIVHTLPNTSPVQPIGAHPVISRMRKESQSDTQYAYCQSGTVWGKMLKINTDRPWVPGGGERERMMKTLGYAVLVVLGLALTVSAIDETTIYFDPLDGADATLTGTSPSDRTGGVGTNEWTANDDGHFQADGGAISNGNAGVWLPFTPEAGNIYTLSASLNTTTGAANFISLGFAQRNNDTVFNDSDTDGYGTMILRQNRGTGSPDAAYGGRYYPGEDTSGQQLMTTTAGVQDFKIILDASDADSADWTMSFYNGGALVGGPVAAALGNYNQIGYAGFSKILTAEGTISDFELTVMPAPSQYVIYYDPLNGANATLTGTSPDDRPGGVGTNEWNANTDGDFHANGQVAGTSEDGVFLPFTPEAGTVYKLSADVDTTSGGAYYISLGFAELNANNNFTVTSVNGYGTMIVRQNRGDGSGGAAFAGKWYQGVRNLGDTIYETTAGSQHLEIVLNARASNPANWTMEFFNNGSSVGGPATASSGSYGDIDYVGFTRTTGAGGTVKNFELAIVPPAGTIVTIR